MVNSCDKRIRRKHRNRNPSSFPGHSGVFCASSERRWSNYAAVDFPFLSVGCELRDNRRMATTTRIQRRYDDRLRVLVQTTGDLDLAVRHGVPRSTARGWRTKTTTDVVSLDVLELDTVRLQHEVILLRRRITRLMSLLRIVIIVLKVSGNSFSRVLVAGAQASMVISEHARYGYHGSEVGGLLY